MKYSDKYFRDFLTALLAAILFCGGALMWKARDELRDLPPLPELYLPISPSYISGDRTMSTDHALFYFGIFGWGKRIRQADILLMGSSHVEFGLSAEQLSAILEQRLGRHYNILNLGRGHGDSVAFTRALIDHYRLRNKIIITDMFDPYEGELSPYASMTLNYSLVRAYYSVINDTLDIWVQGFKDMLRMPDLQFEHGKITWNRSLQFLTTRHSASGDVNYVFENRDNRYANKNPLPENIPEEKRFPLWGGNDNLTYLEQDWCIARRLQCFYTAIPWPPVSVRQADSLAAEHHLSYIPFPRDGLTYWDTDHLDQTGRDIATKRLADKLIPLLDQANKSRGSVKVNQP